MTCTLTHADHIAIWTSWRDDCTGPDSCGFGMVDSDQEPNTVVTVLQKGYLIAERVLRPALVMVAKGK